MKYTENSKIGDIVADNFRTASIFSAENIDFCCHGNRPLSELKNIELTKLLIQLNSLTKNEGNVENYAEWPLNKLAEHIQNKHHTYVEKKIPEIITYLDKLCQVHGAHHPELFEINELFHQAAEELSTHMKKEELILFPFVKTLCENTKEFTQPIFGTVENPINMMKHDHEKEGLRFEKIAQLSNNYTVPEDGCNTYRVCLEMLQDFERDLHTHIHLENNILFPKAIELEKKLNVE